MREAVVGALLGGDMGAAVGVESEGRVPQLDVRQQSWVVEKAVGGAGVNEDGLVVSGRGLCVRNKR